MSDTLTENLIYAGPKTAHSFLPSHLTIVKTITASSIILIGPLYAYFAYPSIKTGLDVFSGIVLGTTDYPHSSAEFGINSTLASILVSVNFFAAALSFDPINEAYNLVIAKKNLFMPFDKPGAYYFYTNLVIASLFQFIPGSIAGAIYIIYDTPAIALKILTGLTIPSLDLVYYYLFYLDNLKQHSELSLYDLYHGLSVLRSHKIRSIEFLMRIFFNGLTKGIAYGFMLYEFGIKCLQLEKSDPTLAIMVLITVNANVYITFMTYSLSIYKAMFRTPMEREYIQNQKNILNIKPMDYQALLKNIVLSLMLRAFPIWILLQNQTNIGIVAFVFISLFLLNLKARHEISQEGRVLSTQLPSNPDEVKKENSWEEQVEIYKKNSKLSRFSTVINTGGLFARFILFVGFTDVLFNQTFADRGWINEQTNFELFSWALLLAGLVRESESVLWYNKILNTTATHLVRWDLAPGASINKFGLWATRSSTELTDLANTTVSVPDVIEEHKL